MSENYQNEAEFIADIAAAFGLDKNESYHNAIQHSLSISAHKNGIVKICNNLIQEFPAIRNTVFALLTYSTQKWASDARREIRIDETNEDVLESDEQILLRQYRGILKQDITPKLEYDYKCRLEKSEEIIMCIEKAAEYLEETPKYGKELAKVIRAAHFMDDHEDVSLYLFNKYYELAVMEIFHQFGAKIDELVSEMTQPNILYGESIYGSSYHNTELLIKIYPFAGRRLTNHGMPEDIWSDLRLQRDSNGLHLLLVYTKAVNLLETYPGQGKVLHDIITLLNQGVPCMEIAKQLRLSPHIVRQLKRKAINLLSFVLWGYSTTRILTNMVLNSDKLS